ncbi:HNH endonuclease family protein [Frigidibacter oleivorans]|uniref:HNH endonuclease n=1 Tax=Frigidibacter oleivorans TaxID=2487129 RepID=UPI000F8C5483|nr:HNH endonuclease [Frigidibacter oleivorans]
MARRRAWTEAEEEAEAAPPVCPLCLRPIPPDVPQSLHHLIPRLKGGRGGPTVLMHHICHKEVHAALTEAELARSYNTPEALRAHPRLARFAEWVAKRPEGFLSRVPGGPRRSRN